MMSAKKFVSLVSLVVVVVGMAFTANVHAQVSYTSPYWRYYVASAANSYINMSRPTYALVGSASTLTGQSDCAGFVWRIHQLVTTQGIVSYPDYRRVTLMYEHCLLKGTLRSSFQPGDVVMFKSKKTGLFEHCGIMTGTGYNNADFAHCNIATNGVAKGNLFSEPQAKYGAKFWINNYIWYFGTYPPGR